MKQLDSAVSEVQDELCGLGLWNEKSRLPLTTVYWCNLPQVTMHDAEGFFIDKGQSPSLSRFLDALLDYRVGDIYIPQWVLSYGLWRNRFPLRDVVRHKYGHAVAYHYPALVKRSRKFRTVFQGSYGGKFDFHGSNDFISEYAEESPCEDFAETFMFFVRHKGHLPGRFHSRHIKLKWKFVNELCDVIDSGAAKW